MNRIMRSIAVVKRRMNDKNQSKPNLGIAPHIRNKKRGGKKTSTETAPERL